MRTGEQRTVARGALSLGLRTATLQRTRVSSAAAATSARRAACTQGREGSGALLARDSPPPGLTPAASAACVMEAKAESTAAAPLAVAKEPRSWHAAHACHRVHLCRKSNSAAECLTERVCTCACGDGRPGRGGGCSAVQGCVCVCVMLVGCQRGRVECAQWGREAGQPPRPSTYGALAAVVGAAPHGHRSDTRSCPAPIASNSWVHQAHAALTAAGATPADVGDRVHRKAH